MKRPLKARFGLLLATALGSSLSVKAQRPYFVTYDHHTEEPGSLEVSVSPIIGKPTGGRAFVGTLTEFEYGAKGWWTTEFYLEGQTTRHDSTVFTGFRWENRFRPLMREHLINPVLYLEFSSLNGADKTMKEVVGFDSQQDFNTPNADTRMERKHEVEAKFILGSDVKGWNVAENLIFEKNLTNAPWEFGYAVGANRPLRLAASPQACNFCRENLRAGVELYGGLGDGHRPGFRGTSQYLAPVLSWELASGTTFRISPTFGLTTNSLRVLLRMGVSFEFPRFGRRMRQRFVKAGRQD